MKRFFLKAAAAAAALILTAGISSPAVYGLRIYDATAQDYPALSDAVHQRETAQTEDTLIVKTDGTLPDFRALHPLQTVQGPDDTYTVTFSSSLEAAAKLPDVCAMPGVEYAEPNALVVAQGDVQAAVAYRTYGMELMKAEQFAEDLRARSDLRTVVVAVVDSGIKADLPVFDGRLVGGATMNGFPQTEDPYEHGTCVASIVADCTKDLPVKIMPVRVLRADGTGTLLDSAAGIRYAADHGAAIVNISFVLPGDCSRTLHSAVDYALSQGALPVICAGNEAVDLNRNECCPADYASGIVVSGCNRNMSFYKHSCYGSTIDLCAPAAEVKCVRTSGRTVSENGTSFAAPHISAIAAMYKLYVPGAGHATLERMLRLNTKDLGDAGKDRVFGWGVPDLSALDGTKKWNVNRTVVKKVQLQSAPSKTTYSYKEAFNPDGFQIKVTYADGFTETRSTQGVQFFDVGTDQIGTHTARARFDEYEVKFDVSVRLSWWQWLIRIFLFGWIWY